MSDVDAYEIVFVCTDCKTDIVITNTFVTEDLRLAFKIVCPQCNNAETMIATPQELLDARKNPVLDSWDMVN